MSEDSFDAPSKKNPLQKPSRKTSERKNKETKESNSYSPLFPIYWIRLLKVLEIRKKDEDDYKSDPKKHASSEKDYSDLKFEGLKKESLTMKLRNTVNNSGLEAKNYNDVLKLLTDPVAPYVDKYTDKKEKERFRITLLGELALEQIEKDKILSGFWNIVKETNLPKEKIT